MNPLNTSASASSPSTTPGRAAGVARLAVVALLLGGAAAGAMAQYKIVGPDGKVTYTDKPPSSSDVRIGGGGNASAGGGGALPYETRQASGKYPVALYAAKSCAPCDSARQWLRGRGIPFSEYSVDNNESIAMLKQRFGAATLPVVTIGRQAVTGYNVPDMQSYADAAGYPAQARLVGYAWPPAVPLAQSTAAASAPPPAANARPTPAAPSTPQTTPPTSRNGIQF